VTSVFHVNLVWISIKRLVFAFWFVLFVLPFHWIRDFHLANARRSQIPSLLSFLADFLL
jgi:hypothetical protein